MQRSTGSLTERLYTLTEEQLAVVDQFVESLQVADEQSQLRHASASHSEPAFAAVWNNPEDDDYDSL